MHLFLAACLATYDATVTVAGLGVIPTCSPSPGPELAPASGALPSLAPAVLRTHGAVKPWVWVWVRAWREAGKRAAGRSRKGGEGRER